MSTLPERHPAGVPVGGQYAPRRRPEPTGQLRLVREWADWEREVLTAAGVTNPDNLDYPGYDAVSIAVLHTGGIRPGEPNEASWLADRYDELADAADTRVRELRDDEPHVAEAFAGYDPRWDETYYDTDPDDEERWRDWDDQVTETETVAAELREVSAALRNGDPLPGSYRAPAAALAEMAAYSIAELAVTAPEQIRTVANLHR